MVNSTLSPYFNPKYVSHPRGNVITRLDLPTLKILRSSRLGIYLDLHVLLRYSLSKTLVYGQAPADKIWTTMDKISTKIVEIWTS